MIRMLAVVVAVAAGIRLTLDLLAPVWPYLAVAVVGLLMLRALVWWRGRW